jgi:tRNA dimethylallyltransferase
MKSLPKIICIVGSTASGKSELAVQLAKKFNGEVVSADSRQVYRGLDIGTGKITRREMRGVPHHLLNVVDPKRTFTVAQFKKRAEKVIASILRRGKVPIICGGTGFYISSLVDNLLLPEVSPNLALRKKLSKKSTAELFGYLKKLDSLRAKTIDAHNPVRLIRAIEIAESLGKVPRFKKGKRKYDAILLGIHLPDKILRKRIRRRLQKWLKQGLIAEVKNLRQRGLSWKRLYDLGLDYRFVSLYLQQKLSKEKMMEQSENAIWQYAKRQKTWWKKEKRIHWIASSKEAERLIKPFLKA